MSNHVHLILQPYTKDLSSGMHRLAFRYAQYFNAKEKRQGYLFQSRFKAVLVQEGVYLRQLIRYIHRNPIRAKMVHHASAYPWSSHQAYKGDAKFTWLEKDLILKLFGDDPIGAICSLDNYVTVDDEEAKTELNEIRKSMGIGAYGNELFVKEFRDSLKSDSVVSSESVLTLDSKAGSEKRQTKITFARVLDAFCAQTMRSLEEIQSSCRNADLVDSRAVLAYLVTSLDVSSRSELSSFLGRDPTSIARLEERVLRSPSLQAAAERIKSTLFSYTSF